jgi:raffinose/stachyose/melibiose transport system substrate-binding protein
MVTWLSRRRHRSGSGGRTRQVAAVATTVVLLAGVGACSSSASPSSGGKPTITIWNDALASGSCGVPAAQSFLTKGVDLFLKTNPGFDVKIVQTQCDGSDAFSTLLKSSEVAGTTPDIGQLYVGGQVIQNGKFMVPLNQALGTDFINSLSGWKYVTDGYGTKTNGSIYGVPFGAGYWYMVYYNKALMARAGITNPAPATWDDLLTLGKQLKSKGVLPMEIGEKEGYVGAWTQDALISGLVGDAGVLQMYNGKASLDSPTLTKPYSAWHDLYASGITNADAPSLSYATGIANFAAGKAAMTITGGFYNSAFTKGLGASNVGMFPVPTLAGSQIAQSLSGGPNNSYVVFKSSKYVADDVKLIKFLTSLPVQMLSLDELGQLPNNVSFTPTDAFKQSQPLLTTIYDYILVKHYTLGEAFDNIMPGTVCNYWYQTNSAVFGGSLNPSSAATSMQTQMQSYLATASTG